MESHFFEIRVSSEKEKSFREQIFSHFVRSRKMQKFSFFRGISLLSVSRKNNAKISRKNNAKVSRKNKAKILQNNKTKILRTKMEIMQKKHKNVAKNT